MTYKNLTTLVKQLRFTISSHSLIALSSAYFIVVLNFGLWRYICLNQNYDSIKVYLFTACLPFFIGLILFMAFTVLFVPYLFKPLLIFLLCVSGATNYFMYELGVFIDTDMVGNAFGTNIGEASDLITLRLIIWAFIGGIIPSIFVALAKIQYLPFISEVRQRALLFGAAAVICGILAAIFHTQYSNIAGRREREMYSLINPYNFIQASLKLPLERMLAKLSDPLDPNATRIVQENSKPTVMILMIGEAARAKNHSLFGYERNTNPLLSKEDLIKFKNTLSCGTQTRLSLPCMFSSLPRQRFKVSESRHQESLLDLLNQTGVNVLWRDNEDGCFGVCTRVKYEELFRRQDPKHCDGMSCRDEILLDDLDEQLVNIKQDTIIVLHMFGSHGPAYNKRYPERFKKFTPTCDTTDLKSCTSEEIKNSYDNTILYSDYVISQAIQKLKAHTDINATLLYLSDHGESLGEDSHYLHGIPWNIAPIDQKHVPMILWMSKQTRQAKHINYSCMAALAEKDNYSQDNLYSSVLSLFGVQSKTYDRSLDIFSPCLTK